MLFCMRMEWAAVTKETSDKNQIEDYGCNLRSCRFLLRILLPENLFCRRIGDILRIQAINAGQLALVADHFDV